MNPTFITTDTETGGLDPRTAPLLSVAVLICSDTYEEYDRGWEQKVLPPPKTLLEWPKEAEQSRDLASWKKEPPELEAYVDVHTLKVVSVEEVEYLKSLEDGPLPFKERLQRIDEGKCCPLIIQAVAASINGYGKDSEGNWSLTGSQVWHSKAIPLDRADEMYVNYLKQAFTAAPIAVTHNSDFDSTYLEYYLPNAFRSIESFQCTMKKLREHYKRTGTNGKASLDTLIKLAGYESEGAHGALSDARSCLAGLRWLMRKQHTV
jgi:DNA polymerase III epsilon subunit-like protein